MPAYYNEHDAYAAEWLRNLIAAGEIAPGDVDERDIRDVRAGDLRGYAQAHFFAGIGGWSVALRLAGWPDDRPVWTGSCPCQPFSAAGKGAAADDERHLWPDWVRLIRACRPPIVFGEQVEAAIGWGWLDLVHADLEAEGYACGAAVLPAASVGAPHIRNRLWFVADDDDRGRAILPPPRLHDQGQPGHDPDRRGADGGLGLAGAPGFPPRQREAAWRKGAQGEPGRAAEQPGRPPGFWSDLVWLPCSDGKARPAGPGVFPLAHGIQRRPSKLRAYGNAIVPQVAAAFIEAVM